MSIEFTIAAVSALVSVVLFVYGKCAERKAREREIKEAKYIGFLEALVAWKTTNAGGEEVGKGLQSIYLVGDERVVSDARKLIVYLEESKLTEKTIQDDLYTAMVYAMKRDLYNAKVPEEKQTKIGISTFR